MSRARDFADLASSADAGGITGKNLIINGAMQVAQRGTSSTTSGYGSVDRFKIDYAGGTVTHTQESLSSGEPYDLGFRKFLRLTNTTAGSTSTTDYRAIYIYNEAQNISESGWNYTSSNSKITLSFWVRSSLAGTYYIQVLSQHGTNQNIPIPFTVLADTWTKVVKNISGYSNITINSDNTSGLLIGILPHYGTDYTGVGATDNTWAVYGSDQTPDFLQNWESTSGATFDLTGVQLEVGEQATPFEHRSFGDELARCQRYYIENIRAGAGGYATSAGQTARCPGNFSYPTTMRAAPTVTVTPLSKGNVDGDVTAADIEASCTFCAATSSSSGSMYWKADFEMDAEL